MYNFIIQIFDYWPILNLLIFHMFTTIIIHTITTKIYNKLIEVKLN